MSAGARGLVEWLRIRWMVPNRLTLLSRGATGRPMAPFDNLGPASSRRSPTSYKLPNDPEVYDGEDLGTGIFTAPAGTRYAGVDAGGRTLGTDIMNPQTPWEPDL